MKIFKDISVLFKAPASSRLGLGHLSRVCSLAWYMQNQGARVVVECETQEKFPSNFLKAYRFSEKVDSYDLLITDGECQRPAGTFKNWVHLGDQVSSNCNANILIDGVPFEKVSVQGVRHLKGVRYHLISPLLYPFKNKERARHGRSCLLNFGAADPGNCIEPVANVMHQMGWKVKVLAGMGFSQNRLRALEHLNVYFPKHPGEVGQLVLESDLCITMGGLGTYEALFLGCPVWSVEWEYMTPYVQSLAQLGWVKSMGTKDNLYLPSEVILHSYACRELSKPNKVVEALSYHILKPRKTVIIVQARLGSKRLPQKSTKLLAKKTIVEHVLERLQEVKGADEIILAVPEGEEEFESLYEGLIWYGSESNVLQRFIGAATHVAADTVVRVTADCPLIQADLVDRAIQQFKKGAADLVTVSALQGFPRGFDVEVLSRQTLLEQEVNSSDEMKEHVTWGVYRQPDKYKVDFLKAESKYSRNWRLCVDEEKDYLFLKELYENLYKGEPIRWPSICAFYDSYPALFQSNQSVKQRFSNPLE